MTTFGYLISQQAGGTRSIADAVQEAVDEARIAEELGYAGVYVSEHHQRADQYIPSPFPLAAYLAAATSTIKVGVAIALLPLYHPLRLMEDATTVDIVSGGRSVLGLGLGYIARDFEVYGLEREEAARQYRELLPQVAQGWEKGLHLDLPGTRANVDAFEPKPVNQSHPPIWIAANTRVGVRMAAEYGDCWIAGARIPLDKAADLAVLYRERCLELGRTPRVAAIRDAWVADSIEHAWEQTGTYLLNSLQGRVRGGLVPAPEQSLDPSTWSDVGETFRSLARGRWLVGSPAEVTDEVGQWVDRVGVDEMVVRFKQPSGPDGSAVLDQMGRWNRDVAKTFAD
jgi:alkanesulfonate monooxygenase SsuD/methylene tetrahydromethanopterin reductase-like flavin-dependent oxidoreductase (luciferase family)